MDTSTPEVEFLDHIVKLIVTVPDEVEIVRSVDDLGVLITLKVAKEDMGRVIGKDGQTAKAIRTLLRAIGSRNDMRINMKILEPEEDAMAAPASDDAPAKCPDCGAEMTEGHVCATPAEEAPAADEPASEAPAAEEASDDIVL